MQRKDLVIGQEYGWNQWKTWKSAYGLRSMEYGTLLDLGHYEYVQYVSSLSPAHTLHLGSGMVVETQRVKAVGKAGTVLPFRRSNESRQVAWVPVRHVRGTKEWLAKLAEQVEQENTEAQKAEKAKQAAERSADDEALAYLMSLPASAKAVIPTYMLQPRQSWEPTGPEMRFRRDALAATIKAAREAER